MRYALINIATGNVDNVVEVDEYGGWTPPEGFEIVQSDFASPGWSYADGTLSPPPVIPPTPEEIKAANQNMKSSLIWIASQAMTPVLMSIQLGNASDDETIKAKAWQAYYRALQAVDITQAQTIWPVQPEA